jgi:hypothetical protein
LIGLLNQITADGDISAAEIQALYGWINAINEDIAALRFLRTLIESIAEDGVVTPSETLDLYIAIERVLPAEFRGPAKTNRWTAGILLADEERTSNWEDDPITEPQVRYLKSLGGDPQKFKTKGEASREIDRLTSGPKSVSNRQLMILRFWNVVDLADHGKAFVIGWLDDFYATDSDHIAAWNLWKEENDDRGRQDDPHKVPLGAGPKYLAKVKSGHAPSVPRSYATRSAKKPDGIKAAIIWGLIAFILFLAFLFWRGLNP